MTVPTVSGYWWARIRNARCGGLSNPLVVYVEVNATPEDSRVLTCGDEYPYSLDCYEWIEPVKPPVSPG